MSIGRVLKSEEVAEILGVSALTVTEYLRQGILKGFKPGGREWRVLESDLEEFIRTQRATEMERRK